jgi:hypothetical protein
VRIVPIEGENYEGRQWGYMIQDDSGFNLWRVWTGGTGPCWNIAPADEMNDHPLHVCNLSQFVEAITALRDSEANAANEARWS